MAVLGENLTYDSPELDNDQVRGTIDTGDKTTIENITQGLRK